MSPLPIRIRNLTLILATIALLAFTASIACAPSKGSSHPPQSTGASREAVFAFSGLHTTWALLDEAERVRVKAIADKGDPALAKAELPKAEARNARLHRVRDALEIARQYIAGTKSFDDCRAALKDAATLLRTAVAELKADGVKIPDEVDSGLAAAGAFL